MLQSEVKTKQTHTLSSKVVQLECCASGIPGQPGYMKMALVVDRHDLRVAKEEAKTTEFTTANEVVGEEVNHQVDEVLKNRRGSVPPLAVGQ